MRYGYIAAALIAVAAGYFLFGRPPQEVTNHPSAGSDIVALGDSLVYGTGAPKGQDFVSLLSQKIGRPVVNLGTPGDTTADVAARLDDLNNYKPKVVILLVGGNDYLRRIASTETFGNLATIIQNIHGRGAIVLLLGVRGGVLVDNFKDDFEQLSDTYKTAYVPDVLKGLLGETEFMADQVHPNAAGHARITERVYPELVKLLQ